jgi:hypothetical protein
MFFWPHTANARVLRTLEFESILTEWFVATNADCRVFQIIVLRLKLPERAFTAMLATTRLA